MSMDLKNDSGDELSPSGSAWSFYLSLAREYGWKPQGTSAPKRIRPDNWKGTYESNDGQRVAKDDAAEMAAALERVLSDPDGDARQREVNRRLNERVRQMAKEEYGIDLPSDDDDDDIAAPDDIRALVAFLRGGGFRID